MKARANKLRVLAIDPGYDRLGLAVVEGDPSKPTYVWSACVEPSRGEGSARLAEVAKAVTAAIKKYHPNLVALETLFFSVNKKTALKVAEARGTVLAAAGLAGVAVIEYSPQQVKLAVTGYGAADKRGVANMIPKLIALPPLANKGRDRRDDELDAIALGIAALAQKSVFAQL